MVTPTFYGHFSAWFQVIFDSGISSAAIMAVVLDLPFNHFRFGTPKNPSVFAASPIRDVRPEVLIALQNGDHVEGGRILDTRGIEVSVTARDADHRE